MTEPREIGLGPALRTRAWCVYHEIEGEPRRVAKVLRPLRTKRYARWHVHYPMWMYTRFKYGIPDLLVREHELLAALPEPFQVYLPRGRELARTRDGRTVLVWERVLDHDGRPSRFASELGPIREASFWREIECMAEILRGAGDFVLGIFNPGDILVQRRGEGEHHPVLSSGILRTASVEFPFGLHRLAGPGMRGRFERNLGRFRQRCGAPAPSTWAAGSPVWSAAQGGSPRTRSGGGG